MRPAPDAALTVPARLPRVTGRRRGRWLACLGIAAAFVAVPLLLGDYEIYEAAQVMVYAVAVLGLDIVFGRTGQLSLAHASFFGVGAYAAALSAPLGIPLWAQPPLVVLLAVVGGAVVAVPTLRLSGLRLALVTLLFGSLFTWAVDHAVSLTGGSQGMTVEPITLGRFDSSAPRDAYLMAGAVALVGTLITLQLGRAQSGRRMLAVRDSELAAASIGVPIVTTKITAFILSAVFAGVAGWFYAYIVGFVSPSTFDLFGSVYFMVAVILGGAGSVAGAWLGAAYTVLVPELFSAVGYPNLFPILGGAVLVLVALLLPGGLVEGIELLAARWRGPRAWR